ncbi:MAG: hypothetical protein GXO42_03060 [bacterium]|nr:hypothetical protein [bacterium]
MQVAAASPVEKRLLKLLEQYHVIINEFRKKLIEIGIIPPNFDKRTPEEVALKAAEYFLNGKYEVIRVAYRTYADFQDYLKLFLPYAADVFDIKQFYSFDKIRSSKEEVTEYGRVMKTAPFCLGYILPELADLLIITAILNEISSITDYEEWRNYVKRHGARAIKRLELVDIIEDLEKYNATKMELVLLRKGVWYAGEKGDKEVLNCFAETARVWKNIARHVGPVHEPWVKFFKKLIYKELVDYIRGKSDKCPTLMQLLRYKESGVWALESNLFFKPAMRLIVLPKQFVFELYNTLSELADEVTQNPEKFGAQVEERSDKEIEASLKELAKMLARQPVIEKLLRGDSYSALATIIKAVLQPELWNTLHPKINEIYPAFTSLYRKKITLETDKIKLTVKIITADDCPVVGDAIFVEVEYKHDPFIDKILMVKINESALEKAKKSINYLAKLNEFLRKIYVYACMEYLNEVAPRVFDHGTEIEEFMLHRALNVYTKEEFEKRAESFKRRVVEIAKQLELTIHILLHNPNFPNYAIKAHIAGFKRAQWLDGTEFYWKLFSIVHYRETDKTKLARKETPDSKPVEDIRVDDCFSHAVYFVDLFNKYFLPVMKYLIELGILDVSVDYKEIKNRVEKFKKQLAVRTTRG